MSIQGYAEGIKYDVVDDKASAAEIIIEESKRLNQIVDQILMLSRLDTANQPLRMVKLQLSDFLDEEVAQIGGYAMKQGKSLKNLVTDPMLFVGADARLLGVIINNIVTNGLRYAKKEVEISAQEKGDAILLTIRDDGCGFSEADFSHLFERFYKGESGNFGLGMSIAKSSVEYMQGRIEVFNNEEGGASVRLTLLKK